MKRLIGIIQFMTRIPIHIDTGFDEEFHKATIYFPIVGLILGVIYYITGVVGFYLFTPYIATGLVLLCEVIMTGGLHLDGVGDTFDGLYSYRDKERILEIMKDSRLGTNGMLAILLLFLLKAGFIYSLLEMDLLWMLILMPVGARTMQVLSCYKTKTPREQGMGNLFIGKISTAYLIGTYGLFTCIALGTLLIFRASYMDYIATFMGITILSVLVQLFVKLVYKKIDGITGDILGCICELSELIFLVLIFLIYRLT